MKKKMVILLQIMIAIVLVGTSVYGAVNATIDLKVSKDTIKRGEEITVTLSLKDVDSNVKSVSGYVNYNKDIIEELTVDSIVKGADNTVKIGNEILTVEDLTNKTVDQMPDTSAYIGFNAAPTSGNDTRIVIDFRNGISENTDLITIKFKVKSNATLGEIEKAIEYKMFVIAAGTEKSEEISKDVKLTISEDGSSNGNQDGNNVQNVNQNQNTATNTNTNKTPDNKNTAVKNNTTNTKNTSTAGSSQKTNNTVDNTLASVGLPATGARAIIIPAIILILCAYISYNRYMKYKQF